MSSTPSPRLDSRTTTSAELPLASQGGLFSFPNPVNELSARLVATGVVIQSVLFLVIREWWVLVPLAYGFLARVASGPRFSPLGLAVTEVIVPRLGREPKYVPGPPKRFAQAIGVVFSVTALVLELAGADGAAVVAIAMLLGAASLEAFAGFCLGCTMFAGLMRIGVVPESVCLECADITGRLNRSAA
ncbi:MAG: hypothetical protein RIS41_1386 [Actinomycetota bacterium]|jgi:hypothetical protein